MRPYPSSASRGKHLAPIDTSSASSSFTPINSIPSDHPTRNAEILAREILQARLYGILPGLYALSIWCSDHYRLDLSLSLAITLIGAYFLWKCYPSSRSRRVSVASGVTAAPDKVHIHTIMPLLPVPLKTTDVATMHLSLPSSSVEASEIVSVSEYAGTYDGTGHSAQERQDLGEKMEFNISPCQQSSTLPSAESPLPAYPPPPYRSKCNSPYPQGSPACAELLTRQPLRQQQRQHTRTRLLVHRLGAAGAFFGFGLWTVWLKFEAPLGPGLSLLVTGAVLAYAVMVYGISRLLCSSKAGRVSSDKGSIMDALQDAQVELRHSGEMVSRRVLGDRTELVDAHHGDGTDALAKSTTELWKRNLQRQSCIIRRSSSSPVLASPTTFSMLHEVKSEFRLWALSFFMLAPSVPWSIGGTGQRRSSVNDAPRGLGIIDMDEHEYDMIQTKEVYSIKVDVAHDEGDSKRPEEPDVFKKQGTRPSKDHVHKRGQSESMAGAITRAPSSQSTLSKLARIHLDPERLGGIFQYYRRRQAATNSKAGGGSVEQEQDDGIAFVVRSSTLPTVRVGLYGAAQKRLWSSTGTMNGLPQETCAD